MSHNDEQLDQFLRLQFSQKKFVQKEQYWNKAQQLIAADRANSSNEYFSAVFSAILLIGLSAGMLWNSGNTKAVAQHEGTTTNKLAFATNTDQVSVSNATNTNPVIPTNNNDNLLLDDASNKHLNNSFATNSTSVNGKQDDKGEGKKATRKRSKSISSRTNNTALTETVITKPSITMQRLGATSHKIYFPIQGVEPLSIKNKYLETKERKKRSYVSIEAGLNGYNAGASLISAINVHAGLRYYYFIAPQWGLSSGIAYSRIHQNMDARKYDNINFGFGQVNDQTIIETKQIDYIEIPVNVHYNMLGNHFINAGAVFAYAIQASSDVTTVENDKSQTEFGYLDAINRKDIQLNLGYSYMAGNKWILSAAYHYGLMDVSNNGKFKSNVIDRNTGIRVTLGYKLY